MPTGVEHSHINAEFAMSIKSHQAALAALLAKIPQGTGQTSPEEMDRILNIVRLTWQLRPDLRLRDVVSALIAEDGELIFSLITSCIEQAQKQRQEDLELSSAAADALARLQATNRPIIVSLGAVEAWSVAMCLQLVAVTFADHPARGTAETLARKIFEGLGTTEPVLLEAAQRNWNSPASDAEALSEDLINGPRADA